MQQVPQKPSGANRTPGSRRLLLGLVLTAAALAGCATAGTGLVRRSPNGTAEARLPGKIVWHDLVTQDPEAAMQFYARLLGWRFERVSDGYWIVHNGDRAIGGIGRTNAQGIGNQWIPQVSVLDVDSTVDGVRARGGSVLLGPLDLRGRGRVVVIGDPQGAVFGLITTAQGDPVDQPVPNGDWLWYEVWAIDPDSAASFYEGLAGYEAATMTMGGAPYRYFQCDGKARLGLRKTPDPKVGAAWVSYLRVDDPAALAARTVEFGGRVLFAPRADLRNGTIAIIADPGGAGLVLQKWPMEKS